MEPSKPSSNSDKFNFNPKLFVEFPFFNEPETPMLSSPKPISKVKFATFIFSPADEDFTGCSIFPLAYTDIGFEEFAFW